MKSPRDDVDDQTHDAYAAVLDNLAMAECFLKFAEDRHQYVRLRWCLTIAASAIWSAFDILNDKLFDKLLRSGRLTSRTSDWFDNEEELVNLLRHGAVHFQQPQGFGMTVGPGTDDVEEFIWIDRPHVRQEPISEVIEKLRRVAATIKKQAHDKMGYDIISFG